MQRKSQHSKQHELGDRRDAEELRRFGYRQQLQRTLGAFSSFALSFSLISITTGIFAGFKQGFVHVGPAVVWSWSIVILGQLLVALVVADLAVRMPLSGYGYQWASRLVNPHFGFLVGWLLLLQFLAGLPGVCAALAEYAYPYLPALHTWGDAGAVKSWLAAGVVTAVLLVHLFGIRLAAWMNDAGVLAEIAGTLFLALALLIACGFGSSVSWASMLASVEAGTGQPASPGAWALSLLLGAWCMTGFEAAADLAEETHDPRRAVPRAVVGSVLLSGIVGVLVLGALVLAMDDPRAAQQAQEPLLDVLRARLGQRLTGGLMGVVYVSIFACALASMAAGSRLVFALARDNMLPGAGWLRRVHPQRQIPTAALVLVWAIAMGVVLGLKRLEWITSIATVAGYLGYAGIVFSSLVARPAAATDGASLLAAWRWPLASVALVWTLIVVAALTIPSDAQGQRVPAIASTAAVLVGVGVYLAVIRRRLLRGAAGPPRAPLEAREPG
ncbi:MAG: APC family permease [Pirellulales bacterium]|nr:APC family permease [Pirellulales bacterium]